MTKSVNKKKVTPKTKVVVKKKVAKIQPKRAVKKQPKKAVKAKPKKAAKVQPKKTAKNQPKKAAKVQPKKTAKIQPKKAVKVQPKKAVKSHPQKVVKIQPKKAVKVQPKKIEKKVAVSKPVEIKKEEIKKEVKNVAQSSVKQDITKRKTIKIRPTSVDKQQASPVMMTTERPKNVGVPASISHKKRLVVSFSNMNPELQEAFRNKYPKGYADYMADLFKVDKPDGSSFYAISMETQDAVYLIKMVVKVDDYDDAQNGLFPDAAAVESDGPAEGETFPDDNTENMADADDDSDSDE